MTRKHTIWDAETQQQIDVPFTPEEETARDIEEAEVLEREEQAAATEVNREQARERAFAAIKANKGAAPWGAILYDLVVAQGWIEPE